MSDSSQAAKMERTERTHKVNARAGGAALSSSKGHSPTVSVVMAVYNEVPYLERSLGSLLKQDYPAELTEIVIADGGSTDGTVPLIRQLAAQHPESREIILVNNPKRTTSSGLNAAIRRSSGEIVVRMDGHARVDRDYIRRCVAALESSEADNVGGVFKPQGSGIVGRTVAAATATRLGNGGARYRSGTSDGFVDVVPFGTWRREIFQRIGYFLEDLPANEDEEFSYRILDHQGRIFLRTDIEIQYVPRDSLLQLARQYFRYGLGKVRVIQLHPKRMRLRHFAPAVFVSSLLASAVLAFPFPGFRWVFLFIGGTYAVVNLSVSGWLCIRYGWRIGLLLPVVFATLHLSYGFGFLCDLVRSVGLLLRKNRRSGRQSDSRSANSAS